METAAHAETDLTEHAAQGGHAAAEHGPVGPFKRVPLYIQILIGLVLGVIAGLILGPNAAILKYPADLVLRLLSALAPPLIFVAVIQALMNANLGGSVGRRLLGLLLLNTVVAILIGITVASVIQPGRFNRIAPKPKASLSAEAKTPEDRLFLEQAERYNIKPAAKPKTPVEQFLETVPESLLRPLVENKVLGVILVAVALAIALRSRKDQPLRTLNDVVDLALHTLITLLHWVIVLVPLGVFGIVASIVGKSGFQAFQSLGAFILAVLTALLFQAVYYLTRVRFGSWVRPMDLVRGCRDALVMAFSTASSTATMPLTYACLRERVGLRASSANMGALVGANFNNDGTALYEGMSALFIAQMLGQHLNPLQMVLVVVTSVFASVGAAGIPEAGLVTMTLVFNAVGLPTEYIAILLTVDWFLDRCRTAINVMGDMNVSCLLDGKTRESSADRLPLNQPADLPEPILSES